MDTDSRFNLHQKIVQPKERNITKRWHICSSQIAVGLLDSKMLHEPEEPVSKRTKDRKKREKEREGEGEKKKWREEKEEENSWVQSRSFTLLRVIQLHVFWFFTVSSITWTSVLRAFKCSLHPWRIENFRLVDTCFFLQFVDTSLLLPPFPPLFIITFVSEEERRQRTCTLRGMIPRWWRTFQAKQLSVESREMSYLVTRAIFCNWNDAKL